MRLFTLTIATTLAAYAYAATCGLSGSDSEDAYYYADSDNQGSYATCSKLCLKDSKCKAFAHHDDTTCLLFASPLAKTFTADSSSPYIFYDRSCIKKTATATHTASRSRTSSATSTATVVMPPFCSNIPSSQTITSFSWFNSTHNCDCAASRPDVGNGTGCLDSAGQWCDPNTVANCTDCGIGVCMTGLPPRPVGYGPADDVRFGFASGTTCEQANPQGFKPREVGEGGMACGPGRSPFMSFTANSNAASSTGVVGYGELVSCGPDADGNYHQYETYYNATIQISCTHDAGFNATCGSPQAEIYLPLVSIGSA